MTELDMIRRARMYMEKLSHGINPLDGTPVADGDLIRNGRMLRCFAFVAEVLDKVVTNSAPHAEKPQPAAPKSAPAAPAQSGPRSLPPELAAMLRPASSIKPAPRTKAAPAGGSEAKHRLPPAVPYNRRADFAYSDRPLPVEEVVQRIHALEPENTEPLSVSPLLDWLTDAGLLAWMPDSRGGYAYLPTQSGGEVGILVELGAGAVLYTLSAQHFIMDALDDILDEAARQLSLRHTPWTPEEDARLAQLRREGQHPEEIAETLARPASAVRQRLLERGI